MGDFHDSHWLNNTYNLIPIPHYNNLALDITKGPNPTPCWNLQPKVM